MFSGKQCHPRLCGQRTQGLKGRAAIESDCGSSAGVVDVLPSYSLKNSSGGAEGIIPAAASFS